MGPGTEQLIRDYLNQLSVAAQGCLNAEDRRALIIRIRAQIDDHVQSAADTSPRAVRQFLDGLGDPAAIVDCEAEWLTRQMVRSGRLRVPDWQKGLRSTVQLRHRRVARARDQAMAAAAGGPVLSGPVVSGPAVNGTAPDQDKADAGEHGQPIAPQLPVGERAAAEQQPASPAISARHVRGDVGISLVTSRLIAQPGQNGSTPGSEADVPSAAPAGPAAASDPATEEAAVAATASASIANEDPVSGPPISAAAEADPLLVERAYGAPPRPAVRRRRIIRKAQPTGAATAAETAASAADVQPSPPPSPPVAAWHLTVRTVKDHPLEAVAITVLVVGTLIYPPIWLLGVLLSLPARAWDYRDKWTGLAGPVLLLAIAIGLYVAIGRGSASLSMFFHHAWLFASYFSRVVGLLGAGFLGWRLVHGHPRWTEPPWNRLSKPG